METDEVVICKLCGDPLTFAEEAAGWSEWVHPLEQLQAKKGCYFPDPPKKYWTPRMHQYHNEVVGQMLVATFYAGTLLFFGFAIVRGLIRLFNYFCGC